MERPGTFNGFIRDWMPEGAAELREGGRRPGGPLGCPEGISEACARTLSTDMNRVLGGRR